MPTQPLGLFRIGGAIALCWCVVIAPGQAAIAPPSPRPNPSPPATKPPIRPRVICPAEVEPLTQALLKSLPQYINRLSHQRGGSQGRQYAIAASQPNFDPLPIVTNYPDPKQGGLYQVFFTLLERQYDTRRRLDYQNYYWLFLAQTPHHGWQLAILYTRRGPYPGTSQAASPLRDATQEVPGRAIRNWLRDCQAGSVDLSHSGLQTSATQ